MLISLLRGNLYLVYQSVRAGIKPAEDEDGDGDEDGTRVANALRGT